jgi:hypothetical protein
MALYTFYPCQLDQTSLSFEAHELEDDTAAAAFCLHVLDQHPSAEFVVVWCAERQVAMRRRIDPALEPPLRREPNPPHENSPAGIAGGATSRKARL